MKQKGFILNKRNLLILFKHCNKNDEQYWWFPGGGLEENEDYENGLKREMKESKSVDDSF